MRLTFGRCLSHSGAREDSRNGWPVAISQMAEAYGAPYLRRRVKARTGASRIDLSSRPCRTLAGPRARRQAAHGSGRRLIELPSVHALRPAADQGC